MIMALIVSCPLYTAIAFALHPIIFKMGNPHPKNDIYSIIAAVFWPAFAGLVLAIILSSAVWYTWKEGQKK